MGHAAAPNSSNPIECRHRAVQQLAPEMVNRLALVETKRLYGLTPAAMPV